MQSRRQFIRHTGLLSCAPLLANAAFCAGSAKQLSIGACDWSIGKSSDPAAFEVAKQIGLQGLMVNIGNLDNDFHLRKKEVQQTFLEASMNTGVEISSVALAELNQVPYKSDPRTIAWVRDSIDVAKALSVPVVLLAFFHNNDLRNDVKGTAEVIRRLREVMPRAEQLGITLGIESYLNAREHMEIIDKVVIDIPEQRIGKFHLIFLKAQINPLIDLVILFLGNGFNLAFFIGFHQDIFEFVFYISVKK